MSAEDVRELVRQRIDQALESLADAEVLLHAGRGGRSIVNRAYYAMFYCVLALLQVVGLAPRKHQGAISLFDKEFVHKGIFPRDLSADRHSMFATRQTDDYQRLEPIGLDEARESIERARRFLAAVGAHLTQAGYLAERTE